ncbi:PD-(D/E)XK nuclease family transposase [Eubacteriaceae bacterium CHKCI004]|nr:PD-(D/E)XK nuclease family transposase [Eubacteriaceae bacterium CHKCI004]
MSKVEHSDTYVRETDSRIRHREFLLQGIEELTLLHDTFMKVALKDVEACQHVIRILMDDPTIEIVEVRSQYRISKLVSKDAVLDILAEDTQGRVYNLEIQRKTTIDHARRTRRYSALVDAEYLEKGKEYNEMPEVYVIYISETDIWETRVTESPVERHLKGQIEEYNDGQHTIYINAAIDDGSPKAALMRYFKTCDPDDMSQGALSRRVHYLKREKGGIGEMCEYSERIFNGGREEERRAMIRSMEKEGIDEETIKKILENLKEEEVVQV